MVFLYQMGYIEYKYIKMPTAVQVQIFSGNAQHEPVIAVPTLKQYFIPFTIIYFNYERACWSSAKYGRVWHNRPFSQVLLCVQQAKVKNWQEGNQPLLGNLLLISPKVELRKWSI